MSRLFLVLFVCMLHAQTASAQIQDKVIRHVKGLTPHTIHTLFEFEYFPSISGAKYGMPAVRFNMNFIEYDDDEREVGTPYYHSTWGNAFGYGGSGVILFEEFITAGISYRPHSLVATSLTWEPIGIYVNPNQGVFGSGLTAQVAVPLVLLEWNERAQGMALGFATQREPNMRMRSIKARFNIKPGTYLSITRQGIGSTDGAMTSFAFGVGF